MSVITETPTAASRTRTPPDGEGFVQRAAGPSSYQIPDAQNLPPFLMTLASSSELWAYISSAGALTAGRGNENRAIFPYETDDKLHRSCGLTGPVTLMRVRLGAQKPAFWEPFSSSPASGVTRSLYKTALGTRIVFEEHHRDWGLTFSYEWCVSDRFGLVRSCTLRSVGDSAVQIELLDGLLNILPAGVELSMQQQLSCLANAYTQCEVQPGTTLGIFAMTSRIVDRPEPAEALAANIAWCIADMPVDICLAEQNLRAFREGATVRAQSLLTGRRGNYLVSSQFHLEPHESMQWQIVVDADRHQPQIADLIQRLQRPAELRRELINDCQMSEAGLQQLDAAADGQQDAAESIVTAHHASNVMFNIMRGGVFARNHDVSISDVLVFIKSRNRALVRIAQPILQSLGSTVSITRLLAAAEQSGSPDFARLCYEYLPVMFSRRHGDPSRPWNRFQIRLRDKSGGPILDYQGNWRDIFQNWEATLQSFPLFTESVIAKFVNASTTDGHNPYRISRDGIDWEKPEPDHPWAHIGYWGDHQVVYLTKLLESSLAHNPTALPSMLDRPIFSYADVPYEIASYDQILRDPHNTITFDISRQKQVMDRVGQIGSDGRLVPMPDGNSVQHVTLAEKLLVPVLAKMCNLVLGGGIWMNTQRPEWNDANNALVGNGLSVVTTGYLRRHLGVLLDLFGRFKADSVALSNEVGDWLIDVLNILLKHQDVLQNVTVLELVRRNVLDQLGRCYEGYRTRVYREGISGARPVKMAAIGAFLRLASAYLDRTIKDNRRSDGLYHAYNLLRLSPAGAEAAVDHLDEMLEGQVAAISSGQLSADEVVRVVEAMFASRLYRADQKTFILYPERTLPGFMQKNVIPDAEIAGNRLLSTLISVGNDSIVTQDAGRDYRFNAAFRNAAVLKAALDDLSHRPQWTEMVQLYGADVVGVYERLFQHARFTGRSGTMYGYEGIGCIYWHMVAKLQLAIAEACQRAARDGEPSLDRLVDLYYQVRDGMCFNKTGREYGAFPTDAYSHTPKHAGAQQPGMTGQVKEAILARFAELGVIAAEGKIVFSPQMLRSHEFIADARGWQMTDVTGVARQLELPEKSLAFTLCQTPVIYQIGDDAASATIEFSDGQKRMISGLELPADVSRSLWSRDAKVKCVHVNLLESMLR